MEASEGGRQSVPWGGADGGAQAAHPAPGPCDLLSEEPAAAQDVHTGAPQVPKEPTGPVATPAASADAAPADDAAGADTLAQDAGNRAHLKVRESAGVCFAPLRQCFLGGGVEVARTL